MLSRITTIYKTRLVLGIIGVFFLSMFMSCQELNYMMFSKTTDAQIFNNHVEKIDQHGEEVLQRVIGYGYLDKDTYRQKYVRVDMDWTAAPTVKIQYMPGSELNSRLVGQTNMVWVAIFFGSLVAGAIGVYWLSREE